MPRKFKMLQGCLFRFLLVYIVSNLNLVFQLVEAKQKCMLVYKFVIDILSVYYKFTIIWRESMVNLNC